MKIAHVDKLSIKEVANSAASNFSFTNSLWAFDLLISFNLFWYSEAFSLPEMIVLEAFNA